MNKVKTFLLDFVQFLLGTSPRYAELVERDATRSDSVSELCRLAVDMQDQSINLRKALDEEARWLDEQIATDGPFSDQAKELLSCRLARIEAAQARDEELMASTARPKPEKGVVTP